MIYIQAFLVCGVACAIAQLIVGGTKLGLTKTLYLFMIVGAILGMLGIFESLIEFGMMGAIVLIAGLSNNFAETFKAAFQGDFESLISFVVLLSAIVFFCGILGAAAKLPQGQGDVADTR